MKNVQHYHHIDMGERDFSFRLLVNEEFIDFEAEKFNQKPYVLSFFPSGLGEKRENPLVINNKNIILSALKKEDNGTLIRLYNSSPKKQIVTLMGICSISNIIFTPFEVKTFVLSQTEFVETNMIGERYDKN